MALFPELHLFLDPLPRPAAGQMAIDQALLETSLAPVLRIYLWAEPSVSFGYSQSLAEVKKTAPALPLVRRWTGGGIVEHTGDWTFALVCPVSAAAAKMPPDETYSLIHSAMVEALQHEGLAARLVRSGESSPGLSCFTAPAVHDVFNAAGEKICGGAQRRTRHGFLHQGSLQKVPLGPHFAQHFATALSPSVTSFALSPALEERAGELATNRYATRTWLEKIP